MNKSKNELAKMKQLIIRYHQKLKETYYIIPKTDSPEKWVESVKVESDEKPYQWTELKWREDK